MFCGLRGMAGVCLLHVGCVKPTVWGCMVVGGDWREEGYVAKAREGQVKVDR